MEDNHCQQSRYHFKMFKYTWVYSYYDTNWCQANFVVLQKIELIMLLVFRKQTRVVCVAFYGSDIRGKVTEEERMCLFVNVTEEVVSPPPSQLLREQHKHTELFNSYNVGLVKETNLHLL